MSALTKTLLTALLWLPLVATHVYAADYAILYQAKISPDSDVARVEIRLSGERLPSRLTLTLDPERHRSLRATEGLTVEGNTAVWKPREPEDSLQGGPPRD